MRLRIGLSSGTVTLLSLLNVACSNEFPSGVSADVAPSVSATIVDVGGQPRVPGRYIVTLRPSARATSTRVGAIVRRSGGQLGHVFGGRLNGFAVGAATEAIVERLRFDPDVVAIEPVVRAKRAGTQVFAGGGGAGSGYWGLDRVDHFGSASYDNTYNYDYTGAGVHIYIVDSGVRGGHEEFTGRIATGACFVTWWEFGPNCSPTIDALGHGTAVAAAAAGTHTGVAKGAWIHPVRVDDGGGGGPACDDLMAGTAWVLNNLQHPAVVNFSVGEIEGGCNGFRMLMEDLVEAGAVVTKAAGNSNVSAHIFTDNWAAGTIVTGGIDPADGRWVVDETTGSNFGNLVSMMGPSTNRLLATSTSNDTYATWRGTSFAAPMIAGVAALVRQAHPGYSGATVRSIVLDSASAVTIGNGQGVANRVLYSRLIAPPPPPPPPPDLTVTISGSQEVEPWTQYTYTAVPGGENPVPPYTFAWIVEGDTVGYGPSINLTFPPASATGIDVRVTDSASHVAQSDGMFFVYASTGQCPPGDPDCHESLMGGSGDLLRLRVWTRDRVAPTSPKPRKAQTTRKP